MNEKPLDVRLAEHIRSLRSDARTLRGAARDRHAHGGEDPEWGGDPDWNRANELDERAGDLTALLGGDAVLGAAGVPPFGARVQPSFRRGQRVQIPRQDGSFGKQLGTYMARVPGEDGPDARAWVRDSLGVVWKVRMADIENASRAAIDARLAQATPRQYAEPSALDLIALWLNDDRLHSDPGTLEDVFNAIRATGRYVAPDPLKCCRHDDDYQGDPADLIADAKAALFNRILARTGSPGERASAEQMLEDLLDLAEENLTPDTKARVARKTLGLPRPDQEDTR